MKESSLIKAGDGDVYICIYTDYYMPIGIINPPFAYLMKSPLCVFIDGKLKGRIFNREGGGGGTGHAVD